MFNTIGSHATARSQRLRSLVAAFSALSHVFVGVAMVLLTAGPVAPSFINPPCAELTMTRLTLADSGAAGAHNT